MGCGLPDPPQPRLRTLRGPVPSARRAGQHPPGSLGQGPPSSLSGLILMGAWGS